MGRSHIVSQTTIMRTRGMSFSTMTFSDFVELVLGFFALGFASRLFNRIIETFWKREGYLSESKSRKRTTRKLIECAPWSETFSPLLGRLWNNRH